MRCEEITREIATPTGRLSQADLAAHLEHCKACSTFSASSAHLDQLWAATRPQEPSALAFDQLWSQVSASLDETPQVLPFSRFASSRRVFWVATSLANAAAILLLCATFWRSAGNDSKPAPASGSGIAVAVLNPVPELPLGRVPVEEGATYVIRINDSGIEVDRINITSATPIMAFNADVPRSNDTDALNSFESMAQ